MLEPWFLLALLSVLAGGFNSFIYKIAAIEKRDYIALSFYASLLSFGIIFVCNLIFSDFTGLFHYAMLGFAIFTSLTYLFVSIFKVRALEVIDAAIFFPLYKVFGPAFVIICSLIFLGEEFTIFEWIGIALSLTVPLLLITKSESLRQNDLRKGLLIVLLTTIIGAISAVAWKKGADVAPNTWTYVLVLDFILIITSYVGIIARKNAKKHLRDIKNAAFAKTALWMGIFQAIGGASVVFAFTNGGALGIVYTINSLYILIPIVLSIIFYNEHWNARKVTAIILSVLAVGFFG